MSLMMSIAVLFFPRDVLDEIWDFTESVSGGFLPILPRNGKKIETNLNQNYYIYYIFNKRNSSPFALVVHSIKIAVVNV